MPQTGLHLTSAPENRDLRFRAGVPVSDILEICRPFLIIPPGPGPLPSVIGSLEPPDSSDSDSLTLVGDRVPLKILERLQAALVLIEAAGSGSAYGKPKPGAKVGSNGEAGSAGAVGTDSRAGAAFGDIPVLLVSSLHGVMAALIEALSDRFLRPEPFRPGTGNLVSPTAVVDGCLEGGVTVGAGACIGIGSFIGSGTRIGPNAIIHEHCLIGRNCVVQAGAVIGSAGFGFFPGVGSAGGSPGLREMPHPAGVEIEEGCWIGANTVIAAGVLSPTTLGRGCKIDSLVQIAHNVRIGEDGMVASHCGIAGSTVVGRRFRMGGSAGLNDHLRIGDDVTVAAFSGVTKDQPDGATVAGFPARPIAEWRHQEIAIKKLGK